MTAWKKYNKIQQELKRPPRDSGEYVRQLYVIEAKEKECQAINRGKLAAFAVAVIIAVLVTCLTLLFRVTTAHAAELLEVARSQIGNGEISGDNRGKFVRAYLNGKEGLPWCAGFVSYCLKNAGYHYNYTLRAKKYLDYGKKVSTPKPGDLIVFSRAGGGGHVGIVEQVKGGTITTIEGNTGKYPSKVKRITYLGKPKNLIAYIRINRMKEA
jgi:uncharacterized protein (TIGR02594 family)